MLVLGVDTSSAAITVALAEVTGDGVTAVAAREVVNPKGHGELLSPTIADCLAAASCVPRDIGAVVAGVGPGPYTGLRVGLVTAAGFADALGVPTYAVCSLDAIGGGARLVVTDARRKEVYWARYDAAGARVAGPGVDRPHEVAPEPVVVGAGARLYPEVFTATAGPDYPDPVTLIRLAADRVTAGAPSEPLTPLYLRHPDAAVPNAPKTVSQ